MVIWAYCTCDGGSPAPNRIGVANIVKATGNYGEIFERNVGEGSPLKIARGINALWTKGGLQYGMPIR